MSQTKKQFFKFSTAASFYIDGINVNEFSFNPTIQHMRCSFGKWSIVLKNVFRKQKMIHATILFQAVRNYDFSWINIMNKYRKAVSAANNFLKILLKTSHLKVLCF